tara:strand:+ start:259 stop:615 length:357 start_codon:yes stop_codon:yes gene_type:complete
MTTVSVTTGANTVQATSGSATTVVENTTAAKVNVTADGATTVVETPKAASVEVTASNSTAVVQTPVTTVVKATFPVPYFNVNDSAKVDKSIVYYDAASGQYKADDTQTTTTLTDGGNF